MIFNKNKDDWRYALLHSFDAKIKKHWLFVSNNIEEKTSKH